MQCGNQDEVAEDGPSGRSAGLCPNAEPIDRYSSRSWLPVGGHSFNWNGGDRLIVSDRRYDDSGWTRAIAPMALQGRQTPRKPGDIGQEKGPQIIDRLMENPRPSVPATENVINHARGGRSDSGAPDGKNCAWVAGPTRAAPFAWRTDARLGHAASGQRPSRSPSEGGAPVQRVGPGHSDTQIIILCGPMGQSFLSEKKNGWAVGPANCAWAAGPTRAALRLAN